MKKLFKSKLALFMFVLMASATASAGLHAYTHNLRMTNLLLDLIYWSEIGSSYAGILLG